jgi:hypothetical protein
VSRRRGVAAVGESRLIGPDPFTVILLRAYPLVTKRPYPLVTKCPYPLVTKYLSLSERSRVEKRSFATRSL